MHVRGRVILGVALLAAGHVAPVTAQTRDEVLITAGSEDHSVWAFAALTDGTLLPWAAGPFAAGQYPVSVAIHPSNRFAYVANMLSSTISGYSIDHRNHTLTPLPGSPYGVIGAPWHISIEPTGRFLYAAVPSSEMVRTFAIAPGTGTLTHVPALAITLRPEPYSVAVHPSGKFLYASADGGALWALAIDQMTGALSVLPGSPYIHSLEWFGTIVIHPSGRFVYVTRRNAAAVLGYAIDDTGTLTLLAGAPFATGGGGPQWAASDSMGRFLYASNYTSVAGFAVDGMTGFLTHVPGSPLWVSATLTAPVVHSSGAWLYGMQGFDNLMYRLAIDPATGALRIVDYPAGGGRGVQAARTTFGEDLIFRNGFESSNAASWSWRTPAGLAVGPQAAYSGGFGLQVTVANTTFAYVQDDSPFDERRYRARFYVNLSGLEMGEGDEFDVLRAHNTLGPPRFRVALARNGGVNRVRLYCAQDDESLLATTLPLMPALAPGWRAIEVDWQAASAPGANDGALRLWVDEVAAPAITGADNDLSRLDLVTWGAVAALEPTTGGTILLDTFESRRWTRIGWALVFDDVPFSHLFWRFVHGLHAWGVTSGCGPRLYCPDAAATREQMAVFLLRSREDGGYLPPVCEDIPPFQDVPLSSPFCRWIRELVARQVIGGCAPGLFCPLAPVTRAQMAVLLLRTLEGSGYIAPPCTAAPFADVSASDPFCPWIRELALRGITGGCGGGNYCPSAAVTRGEMAVFLTRTFGLPVPAP